MATLREIKRRINSIKNTSKITKAMKMVAASKLRRLQTRLIQTRPYARNMETVISNLSAAITEKEQFPLLQIRPRKVIEVLVISADRGLCGSFNANIIKETNRITSELKQESFDYTLSVIGKKARDYYTRRNVPLRKEWTGLSGTVTYEEASEIAKAFIDDYVQGAFDELRIVYNEFESALIQRIRQITLFPITPKKFEDVTQTVEYLYEPSIDAILRVLLNRYIYTEFFRILLESNTSEEAARMVAMENATQNARDMIGSLTLQYNKERQSVITKEMLDIIGGAEALA
ncbi:MAG TPA: ATP synthase F1 subunit gamma [Thermodesulfovibrionia bacterium]|nr:ATP synthase F1 subunit gamma [Thermodesulfovibrionia bacterium]